MIDPITDPRAQQLLSAEPGEVLALAQHFSQIATQADNLLWGLTNVGDAPGWSGSASDAYRANINDVPTELNRIYYAHMDVADAFNTYGNQLGFIQDQFDGVARGLQRARGRGHAWRHAHDEIEALERRGWQLLEEFDEIRSAARRAVVGGLHPKTRPIGSLPQPAQNQPGTGQQQPVKVTPAYVTAAGAPAAAAPAAAGSAAAAGTGSSGTPTKHSKAKPTLKRTKAKHKKVTAPTKHKTTRATPKTKTTHRGSGSGTYTIAPGHTIVTISHGASGISIVTIGGGLGAAKGGSGCGVTTVGPGGTTFKPVACGPGSPPEKPAPKPTEGERGSGSAVQVIGPSGSVTQTIGSGSGSGTQTIGGASGSATQTIGGHGSTTHPTGGHGSTTETIGGSGSVTQTIGAAPKPAAKTKTNSGSEHVTIGD